MGDRSISITSQLKVVWDEIFKKVNKAVVFMDSSAVEACHWNGGGMNLVCAGAKNIKELSPFEHGHNNDRKAVFIVSGVLSGSTLNTIKDILENSSFQYIIVVTGVCAAMHSQVLFGSPEPEMRAFHHLEDEFLEWMGNMNYTVELNYMPFTCAPITHELFLLPDHSTMFPLLPSDVEILHDQWQKEHPGLDTFEVDFTHLDREAQLQIKLLVCSLNSLMQQLSVAEDCYSLGDTSRIVASELAALSWAKQRRKAGQNKASLLLIDRTLDLPSVVGHNSETFLDKMLAILDRLPCHSTDVAVDMTSLCSAISPDVLAPGCLAHPSDSNSTALFNTLVSAKHKESLVEVNRQIVETAANCNLPVKLTGKPGRVTAEQLESTLKLFKGQAQLINRHGNVLQVVQAVAHALHDKRYATQDSLLAVEKGLLQSLGDTMTPSPVSQITQTLNSNMDKPKQNRQYNLEDIFALLIYIYSVMDEDDETADTAETLLRAALEGAILDDPLEDLPEFLQHMFDGEKSEEKIFHVLEAVFNKLKHLSACRESFRQFKQIHTPGSDLSVASLKPLLKQVATQIFDVHKKELVDIEYKSTGLRDLIKSGFGLFMNVGKPRPGDQPILIIFVIGGITTTEIRQVRDVCLNSPSNCQVILGSTQLVRPQDMLERVFAQDNLHPTSMAL